MKYPDINIQMKYPTKLINADTPILGYAPRITYVIYGRRRLGRAARAVMQKPLMNKANEQFIFKN